MNEKRYDAVFAFKKTIEAVRLDAVLTHGIKFESRNSSYFGGDYLYSDLGGPEVRIVVNEDGGEPAETDFPDFSTLLILDGFKEDEFKIFSDWVKSSAGESVRTLEYDIGETNFN